MTLRKIIAHVRTSDNKEQSLQTHLLEVSAIAGKFAQKIGMKEAGQLLGLMHDFGKYSQQFQTYIQSGAGLLNPDIDDDYVDAKSLKGKIDHSSAGAQWVWNKLSRYGKHRQGELCGRILALCIASHHSGLIDCLNVDGGDVFNKRIKKEDEKTNLDECSRTADLRILEIANELANKPLIRSMLEKIEQFCFEKYNDHEISHVSVHNGEIIND